MPRALYVLLILISCSYSREPQNENSELEECLVPTSLPSSEKNSLTFQKVNNQEEKEEIKQQEAKVENISPNVEETPILHQKKIVPRTILALWSSKATITFAKTPVFEVMELPLNVLGFKVEYVDIEKGFPDLTEREDVAGVISWFPTTFIMTQINSYLRWSIAQIESGKKFIIVGSVSELSRQGEALLIDELWNRLGVSSPSDWITFTYDYEVSYQDPSLYPFERDIPKVLPQFLSFEILPGAGESLVSIRSKSNPRIQTTAAVINENGAFLDEAYILYADPNHIFPNPKWLLNPFKFFRKVFSMLQFPIPDPTTMAGRRVYYSQIDGDGWNNISLSKKVDSTKPLFSSQVILDEIIKESPDLPVTVAPIAAEIDLRWFGTEKSREIAKKFFILPQVEIGSHTFSHPFDWSFFENYTPKKEERYLHDYPNKTFMNDPLEFLKNLKLKPSSYYSIGEGEESTGLQKGYKIPRAYALEPFSPYQEVLGAIDEVNQLAPENKKVEIYQWSGNGEAFKQVVELTVKAGVQNINGASNRFDFLNPSYSCLYPLCTTLSDVHQVFNSNSNENEYTSLWTKDYYAFATVTRTFDWTETPIRIKPIDHYYHMYSGERIASLSALKRNIEYIRRKKSCPIHASLYSKTVLGFYSTEIIQIEENAWQIENRGSLQTMRFDRAVFKGVDFNKSRGVIGQRHFQGSLYVALDEKEEHPVIVLKEIDEAFEEPRELLYYLFDSRWNIQEFERPSPDNITFVTQGFGEGEMSWNTPKDGHYEISIHDETGKLIYKTTIASQDQKLLFNLPLDAIEPIHCTISLAEAQHE